MISISNYTGGSGQFYIQSRQSVTIPQNTPDGTIFSLPFVSGVVYRITGLSTTTTSTVNSVDWFVDGGSTRVGNNIGNNRGQGSVVSEIYGYIPTNTESILTELLCQEFRLDLLAGTTGSPIFIVYEIGVIK